MRLRSEDEEGRTWDWPHWTGPGAGALLGVGIAARVDDTTVGVLGGLAVFLLFTAADVRSRRRKPEHEEAVEAAPDAVPGPPRHPPVP